METGGIKSSKTELNGCALENASGGEYGELFKPISVEKEYGNVSPHSYSCTERRCPAWVPQHIRWCL